MGYQHRKMVRPCKEQVIAKNLRLISCLAKIVRSFCVTQLFENHTIQLIFGHIFKGFGAQELASSAATVVNEFVINFVCELLRGGIKFLEAGSLGVEVASGLNTLQLDPVDILSKEGTLRIGAIKQVRRIKIISGFKSWDMWQNKSMPKLKLGRQVCSWPANEFSVRQIIALEAPKCRIIWTSKFVK